jgi:argininosuccinate lyase
MDSRMLPYAAVPAALRSGAQAAALMAEVVGDLTFHADRARAALDDGACCASDLAERLCLNLGLDFRSAHGLVARLIGRLEAQGRTLASLTEQELQAACREHDGALPPVPAGLLTSALDPKACLAARSDVGGAAPVETERQIRELADAFLQHQLWFEAVQHRQAAAETDLLAEARAFAEGRT